MTGEQRAVRDFHRLIDAWVGDRPSAPPLSVRELRKRLIEEEATEFNQASDSNDIVAVADALGDLLVVVHGAALAWGLDLEPIFREIHRTNMLKVDGPTRADGKRLKPEGWQPPSLEPIIMNQFPGSPAESSQLPYPESRFG